ncbi:hypothetical protein EBZ37_11150 [bacterium]|nr:hypothetical protein [bacterium]
MGQRGTLFALGAWDLSVSKLFRTRGKQKVPAAACCTTPNLPRSEFNSFSVTRYSSQTSNSKGEALDHLMQIVQQNRFSLASQNALRELFSKLELQLRSRREGSEAAGAPHNIQDGMSRGGDDCSL